MQMVTSESVLQTNDITTFKWMAYGQFAGTEELSKSSTCVFPNPTSGVVTIVCEGEQPVAVYNLAGQCVYQGVAQGWLKVDLSGFGAGVYAVKVGDQVWRTVVK